MQHPSLLAVLERSNRELAEAVRQRQRLEDELRKRETQLAVAQALAHLGSWDWEIPTGRLAWSDEVYRIVGLEPQGVRLNHELFLSLVHPEDRSRIERALAEALAGSRPIVEEFRLRRPDGAERVVLSRGTVVRSPSGEPQRVLGLVQDVTERKQAEEALRQLSGRLFKVQEEERRRIARELHDSTAQKLAGMLIGLGLLEDAAADLPERARKLVSECLAAAENCAQEIRNLSHLLHPPLLEELGLEAALDTYVAGFAQRSGMNTSLEIDPNLAGLAQAASLALFRVVQESLANVLRHTHSQSVAIQLARVRDRIILEVTDQGQGMSPELLEQVRQSRPGLGVGILGMRERLRQLRGTLEIDSSAQGTTIRAIMPLDPIAS